MVDITHKSNTLREATAQATVKVGSPDTMELINNSNVPKGDIFEMSRTAGLLAIKKTPDILPHCHPIPIEFTEIQFSIRKLEITISVTIKTIYKTGVEVEAMHGASVVALTMYDMLKPVEDEIEIGQIKLVNKTGGKSSFKTSAEGRTARVVVCSNSLGAGNGEDKSGKHIAEVLKSYGVSTSYAIIPEKKDEIEKEVSDSTSDLLIFTGTSEGPQDITSDAIVPLLNSRLPGVEQEIRRYGQERIPYAMFAGTVAGIRQNRIVLSLPSSPDGVTDGLNVIFPSIFHLFHLLKEGHD